MSTMPNYETEVRIPSGSVRIDGSLSVTDDARGLVLFAHGSGSGRFSPRNRQVASALQQRGLGTLLVDLLTRAEEGVDELTGELRFDIDLLSRRVVDALDWLAEQPLTASLRCGLFGSSTGAAAALVAAARRPGLVDAVVSRGGRVDLADPVLHHVRAPCLFIVGGDDLEVVELNRISMDRLEIESRMVVIEGAGHLFEEPGALEQVSEHAGEWFERLLRPRTEYEPLPLQP